MLKPGINITPTATLKVCLFADDRCSDHPLILGLGAVDYIFGDASAWFGECTIASNGGGAITAMSRETSSDPSWYVIDHSTVSDLE